MRQDSITLGVLTFVAEQQGPVLMVTPFNASHEQLTPIWLTLAEWSSLRAVADVLAASDKRHAEDRAEIERLAGAFDQSLDVTRQAHEALNETARKLAAMTAARDEACDLAMSFDVHGSQPGERDRLIALRKVGR